MVNLSVVRSKCGTKLHATQHRSTAHLHGNLRDARKTDFCMSSVTRSFELPITARFTTLSSMLWFQLSSYFTWQRLAGWSNFILYHGTKLVHFHLGKFQYYNRFAPINHNFNMTQWFGRYIVDWNKVEVLHVLCDLRYDGTELKCS